MENVIHQFLESGRRNGLLLLDMPTGSGKTYSVLHYIYESIIKYWSTNKYIFISTLKKNFPMETLYNFIKKSGHEDIFDKNVCSSIQILTV